MLTIQSPLFLRHLHLLTSHVPFLDVNFRGPLRLVTRRSVPPGERVESEGLRTSNLVRDPDLPPGQLGQAVGAGALGAFSSPDAYPRSESLARSQKTLGLPQIQLGLPGMIWELGVIILGLWEPPQPPVSRPRIQVRPLPP